MYRLLTADDEPDKLEVLRRAFDWKSCGVELCGEAKNGPEAYEQLMDKRPDICIMDVRMPGMSGLEVMRRAQEQGVRTKYIILSGYNEFAYAKEALSLSSVEYLLKPCRPADILEAVKKGISLIDRESAQQQISENYRRLREDSREIRRREYLARLLAGDKRAQELSGEEAACQAPDGTVAVCVFMAEPGGSGRSAPAPLLEAVRSSFQNTCKSEIVPFEEKIAAVVWMDDITDAFDGFYKALENAVESGSSACGVSCTAGVSDLKPGVRGISEAYWEAKKAAEAAFFFVRRNILFFAELEECGGEPYPETIEANLLSAVKNRARMEQLVDQFLTAGKIVYADAKKRAQESAITLVCNLYKLCRERGLPVAGLAECKSEVTGRILECGSVAGVRSCLLQFLDTVAKNIEGEKNLPIVIKGALAYIQENYQKRITLETVAEVVHVTSSYLSMLFRQQTGMTLIEYVNRYRVEKSKGLLREGRYKSYEIAFAVGFQDEKYFHMMFKRYVGMTTMQFKSGSGV